MATSSSVRITRVPAPVPASNSFPQADSLPRLLDVLAAACHSPKLDESVLAESFGITPRQAAYYYSAANYVGLTYKRGGWIKPTVEGDAVNRIPEQQDRRTAVFAMILKLPVFEDVARSLAEFGEMPPLFLVTEWVATEDRKVNPITASRRAETALNWIRSIRDEAPDQIEALEPVRMAVGMR